MTTQVLDVYDSDDPQKVIEIAVDTLQADQVVAFPTETVYGLGAAVNDVTAIEKIFEIKGRPESQVLTLAINDPSALTAFAPDSTITNDFIKIISFISIKFIQGYSVK